MSSPEILIGQIRNARRTHVTVEGKTFIVRRPKDSEREEMSERDVPFMEIMERFVIGWENFTEFDLVPGGGSTPVEFHKELFVEWVSDRKDLWKPIIHAVVEEYLSHCKRLAEAEKK